MQSFQTIEEAHAWATEKAKELTETEGRKVTEIIMSVTEGDVRVGFLKKIPMMAQLRIMDKAALAPFSVGAEILELAVLKEHSHPSIYNSDPKTDDDEKIYLGACKSAIEIIQMAVDQSKQLKKK